MPQFPNLNWLYVHWLVAIGFAVVAVLAAASTSFAAEIRHVSNRFSDDFPVMHLSLEGVIEAGDADRVLQILDETPCVGCFGGDGPHVVVTLNSPGGNYGAGVALADYFFESGITTVVEHGAQCNSACAIAFLGGSAISFSVGRYRSRFVEPGGVATSL